MMYINQCNTNTKYSVQKIKYLLVLATQSHENNFVKNISQFACKNSNDCLQQKTRHFSKKHVISVET